MPQPLTFFLLLLPLSSLFFFSNTSHGNSLASNCPSNECGSVKIDYPFWLQSDATAYRYCGYLGFNLTCSDDGKTIFNLPGESFHVKDISYSNNTLTLVDVEVSSQKCPRARQNVTIPTILPLSYNRLDLNLSFYYDCSSGLETDVLPIPCLSPGGNESYVSLGRTEPAGSDFDDWYNFCEEKVVVTVMDSKINESTDGLILGFGDAVKDGFVLDWRRAAAWCGTCEASKGRCGYNMVDYLCFCSDGSTRVNNICKGYGWNGRRKIGIGLGSTGGIMVIMLFCIIIKKLKQSEYAFFGKPKTENYRNIEVFLKNCGSLSPKRYNYSDIKKITNSFRTELGKGGFGSVFKGKLENGCLVAVKVLKGLKGNGDDFINEVATISRTSHVHIVTLLGFCFEGSHRALVYEFMPNGSLDKFIHDGDSLTYRQLRWESLYGIAVGIAKGLEYLHRGCNTRILHFDIKPHNILLNEDFCPKISDFGLAKLCPQKESIISLSGARGTAGYIAPEVFNRNFGGVSHKSDVYSYGMMVLEMVGGRRNISVEVDRTSEIYFPHWIYKRLKLDEELGLHGIMNDEANASSRKMIIVGLWCIQVDPSHRPSMSQVVEMLEGSLKSLQIPPKPFLSSPPRAPVDSSSPLTS